MSLPTTTETYYLHYGICMSRHIAEKTQPIMRSLPIKENIMENDSIVISTPTGSVRDQLTKVVLGTLAGFLAGKATEKAYDVAMAKFRNR